MDKINFIYIFKRTQKMLMNPGFSWPSVLEENQNPRDIFRYYLIPVTVIIAGIVFLLSLIHHNVLQSLGLAIINLLSGLLGTWFAYLIIREYLCGKLNYASHQALNLSVYSAAIFLIFRGIGVALGHIFLGQLFTLLSFIFIRTLYVGLEQLPHLQASQKTNMLVISSLTIICFPVIITQILRIVFGISAFNV